MKRLLVGLAVVVAAFGIGVSVPEPDPGPVPTCDGEQATIVGVAPGTAALYSAWENQGVDVQDFPEGLIRGTTGRDVLVGLVATADPERGTGNGFYAGGSASIGPANQQRRGDLMCGYGRGFDIYYGGRGADTIFDFHGDSHVYLGGCTTVADTGCDYLEAGNGVDKVWGFRVPKGKTQVIFDGDGHDHNYVGLGAGQVVVDGGPCYPNGGQPGDSCANVPGAGDHIHPCPIGSNGGNIDDINIEYFGPSAPLVPPPNSDTSPPCTYNG